MATSDEDNNITANAFDGDGGNVDITATGGIFGIVPRLEETSSSDITVSSQNGVSGDISIETPDIDPSQGMVELPVALAGPEVVRSCREALVQPGSEFVISGRGGLPQGPLDPAINTLWELDTAEQNESAHRAFEQSPEASLEANTASTLDSMPLVEAQGWTRDETGEMVLVVENASHLTAGQPPACES